MKTKIETTDKWTVDRATGDTFCNGTWVGTIKFGNNGIVLNDLLQGGNEHAALVAVAEAAKQFAMMVEIQARGDLNDAEFRQYVSREAKRELAKQSKLMEVE